MQIDGLKDKVCVVTGAAGVLCSTMVDALCAQGAKVAMLDLNKDALEAVAKEFGAKGYAVLPLVTNILEKESILAAREAIHNTWGSVDLLVNGAGGNSPKATTKVEMMEKSDLDAMENTFFGLDMSGFDFVFALNFKGTILPSMVFAEDMARGTGGTIINISSMNAWLPLTKIPAYSAAKASIDNFTKWLSTHLAHLHIRVNAIAPGFFVTNQNRFLLYEEDGKTLTPRGQKIINGTPMGEFGSPEDLLGALLYLASDMSRFVTGVVLPVDGGFSSYSGV